jgi:hypothetical protein
MRLRVARTKCFQPPERTVIRGERRAQSTRSTTECFLLEPVLSPKPARKDGLAKSPLTPKQGQSGCFAQGVRISPVVLQSERLGSRSVSNGRGQSIPACTLGKRSSWVASDESRVEVHSIVKRANSESMLQDCNVCGNKILNSHVYARLNKNETLQIKTRVRRKTSASRRQRVPNGSRTRHTH